MREQGIVLVVDDDPMVRLAVDRQLDALGWDAYVVNSGNEAIRLLEMQMHFDVILIDMRLPDLEAPAVARIAAQRAPAARILFMAAQIPATPPGGPVLLKPFSTVALARALDEASRYPR